MNKAKSQSERAIGAKANIRAALTYLASLISKAELVAFLRSLLAELE